MSAPGAVLYKQYDDPQSVYDGEFDEESLKAWLVEKAAPLVPELDQYAP